MKDIKITDLIDISVQDETENGQAFDYLRVAGYCIMKAQQLYTDNPETDDQIFANMHLIQEMKNIQENASLFLAVHNDDEQRTIEGFLRKDRKRKKNGNLE